MYMLRFPLAAGVLVGLLATPALAQFDTAHNHLKCYAIRGPAIKGKWMLQNQFGREVIFKIQPKLLCAPTQKTCCDPAAVAAGCQAVPCQPDPVPPNPVHHYKCYRITFRQCTAADTICATPTPKVPKGIVVDLFSQFGSELNVSVGRPQLLCAPVQKVRVDQTTSTTTSTTVVQTTSTTTTTLQCRDVAPAGQPPMCAGPCPTGTGLECVFVPLVGCTCEIGCALEGPAPQTCNMQFCPNAVQQCQPTATNPCGCCGLVNAPCVAGADCCSGTCAANQCQ